MSAQKVWRRVVKCQAENLFLYLCMYRVVGEKEQRKGCIWHVSEIPTAPVTILRKLKGSILEHIFKSQKHLKI